VRLFCRAHAFRRAIAVDSARAKESLTLEARVILREFIRKMFCD